MKTLYKFGLIFAFVSNAHAATVAPKITQISVTPTSATAGTMFKFTVALDNSLPAGYKVKIDFGNVNGSTALTGTKNSYSLSRAIYTIGKQTYNIEIYNEKGSLQGEVISGTFTVSLVNATTPNHAPTLKLISSSTTATANTKYTVTLNAKDIDANLSSITMNWGDSTPPDTLIATDSKDLVFSHAYATASSFSWSAIAKDEGAPPLNSNKISKIITVSNPVPVQVIAPPAKTTGYTKIANNGSELLDSAKLGSNPTDWACTKDNKTGLIWEVKTNDGGLRDWRREYTSYTADYPKCDESLVSWGVPGWCDSLQGKYGDTTNTDGFISDVNSTSLCGANDWRLPTKDEQMQLIYCSDNYYYEGYCKNYGSVTKPTINKFYFPNTQNNVYWSSSPYSSNLRYEVWIVDFDYDYYLDYTNKNGSWYVRLVRNAQ